MIDLENSMILGDYYEDDDDDIPEEDRVTCELCGKQWHMNDRGMRWHWNDGEVQCLECER